LIDAIGPPPQGRNDAMTAPERRRPLPALVFIGALSLFTALVWFRVLHRTDQNAESANPACPSTSQSATAPAPTVLPVAGQVSVIVLNSTNRNGIARAASKVLAKAGFKMRKADDDSAAYGGHGLIKGVAEIRYPSGALASATLLSYYFPRAGVKLTDSSDRTVMVSLGAQFKRVTTTASVRRALVRAHLTQRSSVAPPTPTSTSTASGAAC
jgi:hypothetical protein